MRRLRLAVCLLLTGCVEPYPMPTDAGPMAMKPKGCSPLTCTGCCFGDQCVGGNTDGACGYDGRQCEACGPGTRCEGPGACYVFDPPPSKSTPSIEDPRFPSTRQCFSIGGLWVCS